MEVIIDRFEGDYVLVEIDSGKCVSIPKILIPNAKEGDVVIIQIDKTKTNDRKENLQKLMNNIFED